MGHKLLTPQLHTAVLAFTSFWLFIPAQFAYADGHLISALLLSISALVSFCHWIEYKKNSALYYSDIICANTSICYFIFWYELNSFQYLLLLITALFFVLSCLQPVGSWYGLISHICFRYMVFWAVQLCFILQPTYIMVAMYTIYYITSVIGLLYSVAAVPPCKMMARATRLFLKNRQ